MATNSVPAYYTVADGDTVSLISCKLYRGNPSLWRQLLDYNNIIDPRLLATGQVLQVPQG